MVQLASRVRHAVHMQISDNEHCKFDLFNQISDSEYSESVESCIHVDHMDNANYCLYNNCVSAD